ncbi:MAG: hypothetical protein J6I73_05895 [Treponema sp.]|nr:hypothetical protein [Treponema sp.]
MRKKCAACTHCDFMPAGSDVAESCASVGVLSYQQMATLRKSCISADVMSH